ncbi:hypothetical protein [Planktosalinus lacus]|uniref:General stress protein CsbD n=1 Tax=Planktosalinus lacus TaxID=1526573 RepID=A0A8J2VAD7_9FLAO|nr:hypothetical protein [Planktosalinus lacus]GGD93793.1 hypothetical protein GCM10011312_16930 [Planktosalinus lacus]
MNPKTIDEKSTIEEFKIKGDWEKQSSTLKRFYPTLTNEDLNYQEGTIATLIKKIAIRLGKNRNEVIGILKTNQETVS